MKTIMALFIAAATIFSVAGSALADHENCRDGYYFDEDEDKCVRDRGSHG